MIALAEVSEMLKSRGRFYLLEPSAGKGDILKYVAKKFAKEIQYYFMEIDQERAEICQKATAYEFTTQFTHSKQQEKFRFLGYDFLQYSGTHQFDLILMNPPFNDGAEHLLKAVEISNKTRIVCLLNAETIRNPYSEERRRLASIIEKYNGQIVYLDRAFSDAERRTDVDVAMVRLDVDKAPMLRIDYGDAYNGPEKTDIDIPNMSEVERTDYIQALCRSYQMAFQSTRALFDAFQDIVLYTSPFIGRLSINSLLEHLFRSNSFTEFNNGYADQLQAHAWEQIFSKTKLKDYATHEVKQNFAQWVKDQGRLDLNAENINTLFAAIFGSLGEIKKRSITEGLQVLLRANDANFEGNGWGRQWKTNSRYMVTKKSIIPQAFRDYGGRVYVGDRYSSRGNCMYDLDRALCFLTGKVYSEIRGFEYLFEAAPTLQDDGRVRLQPDQIEARRSGEFISEFFVGKCYTKAGTVHLTFVDEKVMEACNKFLADGSLPGPEYFAGKNRRDKKDL